MIKPQQFSFSNLEDLLKCIEWVFIEVSPLDDWAGLISFEDVVEKIRYEHLELEENELTKIKIILNKLTKRFLRTCPYASNLNELRHSPAFVTLPTTHCWPCIVGMVFKLDNNGTTYICIPKPYYNLWILWFQLLGEKPQEVITERFRILK